MKNTAPSVQTFTSSEAGAWSNSYLVASASEAILFDVPMLRSDARKLVDMILALGKTLRKIMISHAHPDHFMSLDLICDSFPQSEVVSTENVVNDIKTDGPWMLSFLQKKIGPEAATRLVIPQVVSSPFLELEGTRLEIVEFGECEAKHIAALYLPDSKTLFSADLVYNNAHLYLQERHLDSWLQRLDELNDFVRDRVSTIYPGHGSAAGPELIPQTRTYLADFAEAIKSGNAGAAEQHILAKYPSYHVRQFLTAFSIPAYFPATS
jgi:glyoxylase-like metal-dependent hydrolase (beta-lactamase superfamily II)